MARKKIRFDGKVLMIGYGAVAHCTLPILLKHYTNAFLGYNNPDIDYDDPWQFKNFLISDR